MACLHITLFGHVTVVPPNDSVPLKLSRSTQAFLAYLLLQKELVPRDVLMDVFWGDDRSDRARSSLNTAIWRLRHSLEPDDVQHGTYLITKNSGEVGFNWESSYWLDTESFEETAISLLRKPLLALDEADIESIDGSLTHYRGELLQGIYEDWALGERERFRLLYLSCLTRLMEFHANRHNFEQSISYGQAILQRDPLREEVHRDLMRLYLETSQRTLAIRQYTQCCDLLMQELGIPPLEETQELYRQIFAGSAPQLPANGQSSNQKFAQVTQELQLIKRSLHESAMALERLTRTLSYFANLDEDSPPPSIPQKETIPQKQYRNNR